MKAQKKQLLILPLLLLFQMIVISQGLPPGWDYSPTPTTHIVSIPLECEPNINGWPLKPGDWIGVFYLDDEGELACGGAVEWFGDENTGVIAFGDDSFSPEKDGFDSGEPINWKVYSWGVEKAYDAEVTCDSGLPSPCNIFTANGLSGITALDATGFYIVAVAGPDSLCLGDVSQLNANPSGGSGTYSYSWASDPPGFNSNIADPIVSPLENTVYSVEVTDGGETLGTSVAVSVFQPPVVSAGDDIDICENEIVSLNGDVTNFLSFLWTTSGDGVFSNPGNQDPDYTPGPDDISNGVVTLTLTAQPIAPCIDPVSSNMLLTIAGLPEIDAGLDQTVCEDGSVQLAATAENFSSLLWVTSGDGTFNDPSLSDAIYAPGPNDLANGNVELEIEAYPVAPCTGNVSDIVYVTFVPLPEVNAGNNIVICENEVAELSGGAVNFESILWVSTGDGSFGDPTSLNTTYSPGLNDIQLGAATLTLTAQPQSPCVAVISDDLALGLVMLPEVNAGDDATVCEDDIHQLNASATNYEEVVWSSSGDGVFGDPNSLNTSYTPGSSDIIAGGATLTLTALPQFPCSLNAADDLTLAVIGLPEIDAGENISICEDQTAPLNATGTNYEEVVWSTSGDGTFGDPNSLNTSYNPGSNDILTGGATLTLTALPQFPCSLSSSDNVNLTIMNLPDINAGENFSICEDQTAQLNASATNYEEVAWSTSGDGTFDDPTLLNATYTPGSNDISSGGATLMFVAAPLLPCVVNIEDELILSIVLIPEVSAGGDASICEDGLHQLNGQAFNFLLIQWVTDGDGAFNNSAILDPVYTPGPQDIENGSVMLSLTALPVSPCTEMQQSDINLSIINLPMADAGPDATIPPEDVYLLAGDAENYSTVLWATSGDGEFSDTGVLGPFYTPGEQDIATTEVTLSLTANPLSPCTLPAIDDMILKIDTLIGINQIVQVSALSVFPNPNNGRLQINIPPQDVKSTYLLKVFTFAGKLISEKLLSKSLGGDEVSASIDISGFPNGAYFVELSSGVRVWQAKVILQKE